METELQAAFEEILWFVNIHLANTGQGDFENEAVTILFNRDMMMDEGQIIENIRNSEGILSNETLIAQHPWVQNIEDELKKLERERQKEREEFEQQQGYNPWGKNEGTGTSPSKKEGDFDGKGEKV